MSEVKMAIDLDRCTGCHTCTVACQMEKGLAPDYVLIPVLTMGGKQDVPQGRFPDLHMDYVPTPCVHCQNPPCAGACPMEAVYQREDGLVLVDESLCTGCGDCVSACPYEALIMDAEGIAHKCDLCASRLDRGEEPACVMSCPTRAIRTGGPPDSDRSWAPAPHRGTGPTLHYLSRDQGRTKRVSSFFNP